MNTTIIASVNHAKFRLGFFPDHKPFFQSAMGIGIFAAIVMFLQIISCGLIHHYRRESKRGKMKVNHSSKAQEDVTPLTQNILHSVRNVSTQDEQENLSLDYDKPEPSKKFDIDRNIPPKYKETDQVERNEEATGWQSDTNPGFLPKAFAGPRCHNYFSLERSVNCDPYAAMHENTGIDDSSWMYDTPVLDETLNNGTHGSKHSGDNAKFVGSTDTYTGLQADDGYLKGYSSLQRLNCII